MVRISRCFLLLILPVASIGCGGNPVRMDKEFDLPIEGKTFEVDPVNREQKLVVTATTEGGPIHLFVFLRRDLAAVEKQLLTNRTTDVLAHQLKAMQVKVEATIPPNETAMVRVDRATAKGAKVRLKIEN